MHQPKVVVHLLFLLIIISLSHSAPLDDNVETPIVLNVEAPGGIFKGSNCKTIIRGPDGSKIVSDLEHQIVTIEAGKLQIPDRIVALVKNDIEQVLPTIEVAPKITSTIPIQQEEVPIPSLSVSIPEENIASSVSTQQFDSSSAGVKNDIVQSIDAGIAPQPKEESSLIGRKSQDHVFETIIVDAPEVEPEIDFDLKGSSGRIITKGSISIISGPSSTTISEPRKLNTVVATKEVGALPENSAVEVTVPKESAFVGIDEPQEVPGQIPVKIVNDGPIIIAAESASLPSIPEPEPEKLIVAVPESLVKSEISIASSSSDAASEIKQSIPVVQQSSTNNEDISLSSTDGNNNSHLEPVALPSTSLLATAESPSENKNNNVQKIRKIENIVIPNGRVDLGEFENENKENNNYYYNLPHVLSMALSSFYRKSSSQNPLADKVEIDDKIGDLSENEILFDNSRTLIPPDLSKSKHIGPALAAKGVDASQIFLERIPLREVSRLAKSGPEIFGVERAYRIM